MLLSIKEVHKIGSVLVIRGRRSAGRRQRRISGKVSLPRDGNTEFKIAIPQGAYGWAITGSALLIAAVGRGLPPHQWREPPTHTDSAVALPMPSC